MNIFKIILEWAESEIQSKLPNMLEGLKKFGEVLASLIHLITEQFK